MAMQEKAGKELVPAGLAGPVEQEAMTAAVTLQKRGNLNGQEPEDRCRPDAER